MSKKPNHAGTGLEGNAIMVTVVSGLANPSKQQPTDLVMNYIKAKLKRVLL